MGAATVESASAGNGDLKRLGFVRDYTSLAAEKALGLASSAYATGKGLVPESYQPHVRSIEEKAQSTASPYVAGLQDRSTAALNTLDSSVDSLVTKAHGYYQTSAKELKTRVDDTKTYHEESLDAYRSARAAYLKKVEEAVEFLKKEGISGTARLAADTVSARLADAKKLPAYFDKEAKTVLAKVSEAWSSLTQHPAVQKALDSAQPHIDYAWKQYLAAHHTVAASPYYHKAYGTGTGILEQIQSTDLYKGAVQRLSPYAEPTVDKITNSPYYKATVDHLKPLPTSEKKKVQAAS